MILQHKDWIVGWRVRGPGEQRWKNGELRAAVLVWLTPWSRGRFVRPAVPLTNGALDVRTRHGEGTPRAGTCMALRRSGYPAEKRVRKRGQGSTRWPHLTGDFRQRETKRLMDFLFPPVEQIQAFRRGQASPETPLVPLSTSPGASPEGVLGFRDLAPAEKQKPTLRLLLSRAVPPALPRAVLHFTQRRTAMDPLSRGSGREQAAARRGRPWIFVSTRDIQVIRRNTLQSI